MKIPHPLKGILKKNTTQLVPNYGNLFFYNEGDFIAEIEYEAIQQRIKEKLTDEEKYAMFLMNKNRHPFYDIYACFQPFNEATKALYPFLKKLRSTTKKGEAILNLWDRTGWMTNLLAGFFPENIIITTWEGNKDVLGYSGHHYWMRNQPNINIVYCDLNKPLPFESKSIAFSIGLDVLHRFDRSHLLEELVRVVKDEGAIIFPHVHLSNSQPKNYFERGGTLLQGIDYAEALKKISTHTNLEGYVFSEPALFTANDILQSSTIELISNPTSTDYNALIALLPKSWQQKSLSAFTLEDETNIMQCRILVNLLVQIDFQQQKININQTHLNGQVGEILQRHPIYETFIQASHNYTLTELGVKIIYLAQQCYTVASIANQLNIDLKYVVEELYILQKMGLIAVLPISEDAVRLQYFLMSQAFIVAEEKQTFANLWQHTLKNYREKIGLITHEDQSEFSYNDCNLIIEDLQQLLNHKSISKGDKIILVSKPNAEAILLSWACMLMGIIVVPISPKTSKDSLEKIIKATDSVLHFFDTETYQELGACIDNKQVIVFDGNENPGNVLSFSDWLACAAQLILNYTPSIIDPNDVAVILYTSGSTGAPKGVQLTQANLYRSGQTISDHFNWNESDIFYAHGGLETMSGLRNTLLASLFNGVTVVVPNNNNTNNLFALIADLAESRSTIFSCNPSLLGQLNKFYDKIGSQLSSVKTLMCTGNVLTETLREQIMQKFKLPVINYYGATETTGICIAQKIPATNIKDGNIGEPINCIAQIVDNNEKIVATEEKGELRIFSTNLMKGYLNEPTLTNENIRNGWYYTNDLACYTQEGNIKLLGRKREYIKSTNEEIIYLSEIHDKIIELDFIEEIVVTTFHIDDSERIAAYIVLRNIHYSEEETKNTIRLYVKNALGETRVPHKIVFLEKLPYNEYGKLNKEQIHAAI